MRVLQVIPSFYPAVRYGGPMRSTHALCRELAALGADVTVLTTNADGPKQTLSVPNTFVQMSDRYRVLYCRRMLSETASPRLLRELYSLVPRVDIVHLHAVYNFGTMPTLAAVRAFRKPLVWSPRGALLPLAREHRRQLKVLWDQLAGVLAPNQTLIHTTSEPEAAACRVVHSRLNTIVIRNGVDVLPDVTWATQSRDRAKLHLVFIGRLHPIKGLESLLSAMKMVRERSGSGVRLTIAGAGDEGYIARLREAADAQGLGASVVFTGFVDDGERSKLLASAHVLVLPSKSENFGMVVAEALAQAVPVIATTGTPWQELSSRGCGLWVEPTPSSLAEAIETMMSAPLEEMGRRGRQWMVEEFSWSRVAQAMSASYHRLVGQR